MLKVMGNLARLSLENKELKLGDFFMEIVSVS
jgi:hypothetical protein